MERRRNGGVNGGRAANFYPGSPGRLNQPCQTLKKNLFDVAEMCLTCRKGGKIMQYVFDLLNSLLIIYFAEPTTRSFCLFTN